eukprot:4973781-Ditylum_brightwellii.AAC.1
MGIDIKQLKVESKQEHTFNSCSLAAIDVLCTLSISTEDTLSMIEFLHIKRVDLPKLTYDHRHVQWNKAICLFLVLLSI